MSAGDVKIKITADGSGIEETFKGIHKSLDTLKSGLKAYFVTAMADAVSALVKSTIEFVVNAKKSADELGISLDKALQLNRVMAAIGKSGGDLVSSMKNIQSYMASAYYDAFKMSRLNMLGISKEDFENFDFDKVLRKALESTKKMSRSVAQQLMGDVFGSAGTDYLMNRDRILREDSDAGLTKEAADAMTELEVQFNFLKDATKALTAEAILPLVNVLLLAIAWIKDHMSTRGIARKLLGQKSYVDEEIQRQKGAKEGKIDIKNPVLPASQQLPELTGGNPFLSVGGLAGVDTSFRIERYLANIERYTGEMASKMGRDDTQTPPKESALPSDQKDWKFYRDGGFYGA